MTTINENLTPDQEAGIETQDVTNNGVIDTAVLESSPAPIPEQQPTSNAGSAVQSLAQTALEARKVEKAEAEKARVEAQKLRDTQKEQEAMIRTLSGEVIGQADAEAEAFAQAGVGKRQKEIDALDQSILDASTALAQQEVSDKLAVESLAGQGKGIPASIVRGKQALLQNQLKAKRDSRSIELANTIATSKLLQGKVDSAKEAIQHAVELKFADKERELELEVAFLSRTDSKLAKAKETELAEIQRQKDEAKEVFDIQARVAQAGGSAEEIANVGKAQSVGDALKAAPSLGRAARLDAAYKNLQMSATRQQMAKTSQEMLAADIKAIAEATAEGGTPEELAAVNKQLGSIEGLTTEDKTKEGGILDTIISQSSIGVKKQRIGDRAEANDYISRVENILKVLTLDTFAEAKAKGMTFGAMSEGEWAILAASASALTERRITTGKNNRVIGYTGTKEAFISDMNSITKPLRKRQTKLNGMFPEEEGAAGQGGVTRNPDGSIDLPDVDAADVFGPVDTRNAFDTALSSS